MTGTKSEKKNIQKERDIEIELRERERETETEREREKERDWVCVNGCVKGRAHYRYSLRDEWD